MRGSVVWLPDTVGEYEVKVEAVNAAGELMATEQRHIIVGNNAAPTISITGFVEALRPEGQSPRFVTVINDSDGDEIRRIEYFDNGILLGDTKFNFLEEAVDIEDKKHFLMKGIHQITAKVYDSRGAVGETAAPFTATITQGNSRPLLSVSAPVNGAVFQQGANIPISFTVSDPDGNATLRRVEAYDVQAKFTRIVSDNSAPFGGSGFFLSTTGWELGTHTLKVTAFDNVDAVGSASTLGTNSLPVFITVFIKSPGSGNDFAADLAGNIADSASAAASGAVFKGTTLSTSSFSGGTASGLQIDSGVVLTTGKATDWNAGDLPPLPDLNEVSEGTTTEWFLPGDDALKDRVAGNNTGDAAVLEFDVLCTNGQLELEYQFGSEEYDEYIGEYNDGFMISVDGVIVNLLPDCSDIIAVNTVHNGRRDENNDYSLQPLNRHLFLDDDLDINPVVTNQPTQVEYDGVTVRLRSHVLVTPGTHRLRIVIADVTDFHYDSGLFIRQGSLRTIQPQP